MHDFEEQRLRILERVSAGELTPQQGQLEIAMLKVRAQEPEGALGPSEPASERGRDGLPPLSRPSPLALGLLLVTPFVVMGLVLTVGLALFLALPAYLITLAWNGLVVPAVPGATTIAFLPTLAILVGASLLSTVLRWRRKVKVFMAGGPVVGGPFREQ